MCVTLLQQTHIYRHFFSWVGWNSEEDPILGLLVPTYNYSPPPEKTQSPLLLVPGHRLQCWVFGSGLGCWGHSPSTVYLSHTTGHYMS